MKKNILKLLTAGLLTLTLAACGGKKNNSNSENNSSPSEAESTIWPEDERIQTYNFYLDFWHSDKPIYTLMWWQYRELGSCPEEAKLTDANASDPLFPHFLGYSRYSSSLDGSLLWDFANEAPATVTINLYGIWVSND